MLRKLFSSSFNNVGRISQISSLASTIHTLTPSASQKRMIVSTLKSTSESCANVLSKIEREEGFQISRSDLNRWTKLFEKQGQTQKSLQVCFCLSVTSLVLFCLLIDFVFFVDPSFQGIEISGSHEPFQALLWKKKHRPWLLWEKFSQNRCLYHRSFCRPHQFWFVWLRIHYWQCWHDHNMRSCCYRSRPTCK